MRNWQVLLAVFTLMVGMLVGRIGGYYTAMRQQFSTVAAAQPKQVVRLGAVVGVEGEMLDDCVTMYKHAWPQVRDRLRKHNFTNCSVYLGRLADGKHYLFSYCEYASRDLEADLAALKAEPDVQFWWESLAPMEVPQPGRREGEQWMEMEEIFHNE